jgi:hypothetical protein
MKQKRPAVRPISTAQGGREAAKMNGWRRQAATVLGVATMTCAACLTALWPTETQADDEDSAVAEQDDTDENATRIGKLRATSQIVRDERLASTWYLELKIENRDLIDPQAADIEGSVLAMDMRSEMSRVPSMPRAIFKCTEQVVVAAGETAVRRCKLPADVAKRVAAAHRKAAPMANQAVVRGETMFRTTVVEVVKKKQAGVRQATRS